MLVIQRPLGIGVFEFAVLAGLRALQLTRGCVSRTDGAHTVAVAAMLEVSSGMVKALPLAPLTQVVDDVDESTVAAPRLEDEPDK